MNRPDLMAKAHRLWDRLAEIGRKRYRLPDEPIPIKLGRWPDPYPPIAKPSPECEDKPPKDAGSEADAAQDRPEPAPDEEKLPRAQCKHFGKVTGWSGIDSGIRLAECLDPHGTPGSCLASLPITGNEDGNCDCHRYELDPLAPLPGEELGTTLKVFPLAYFFATPADKPASGEPVTDKGQDQPVRKCSTCGYADGNYCIPRREGDTGFCNDYEEWIPRPDDKGQALLPGEPENKCRLCIHASDLIYDKNLEEWSVACAGLWGSPRAWFATSWGDRDCFTPRPDGKRLPVEDFPAPDPDEIPLTKEWVEQQVQGVADGLAVSLQEYATRAQLGEGLEKVKDILRDHNQALLQGEPEEGSARQCAKCRKVYQDKDGDWIHVCDSYPVAVPALLRESCTELSCWTPRPDGKRLPVEGFPAPDPDEIPLTKEWVEQQVQGVADGLAVSLQEYATKEEFEKSQREDSGLIKVLAENIDRNAARVKVCTRETAALAAELLETKEALIAKLEELVDHNERDIAVLEIKAMEAERPSTPSGDELPECPVGPHVIHNMSIFYDCQSIGAETSGAREIMAVGKWLRDNALPYIERARGLQGWVNHWSETARNYAETIDEQAKRIAELEAEVERLKSQQPVQWPVLSEDHIKGLREVHDDLHRRGRTGSTTFAIRSICDAYEAAQPAEGEGGE